MKKGAFLTIPIKNSALLIFDQKTFTKKIHIILKNKNKIKYGRESTKVLPSCQGKLPGLGKAQPW